jgi:hypothetical protein
MKRSVEVSNDINHPRGAGTEADAQMLADAPKWWKDKVIAIRSAKNEAEVRAICSRSSDPNQRHHSAPEKRSSGSSRLADLAWQQFVADPKRFAEKHGVVVDDSRERRIQVLNAIL